MAFKFLLDHQLEQVNKKTTSVTPELSLLDFDNTTQQDLLTKNLSKRTKKDITPSKESKPKDVAPTPLADKKWHVVKDKKFYGPYTKAQLYKFYKAKKITSSAQLRSHPGKQHTTLKEVFAKKSNPKEKILKFAVAMALADGKLDEDELSFLNSFCEENNISKKVLNEMISFLKGESPPPISLIDETFTYDDFLFFVDMAKADGHLASAEVRLLTMIFKQLKKDNPALASQKLADILK
ncbi:MAG: hypothetical protein ISR65_11405 [Bacteriovoracaceae bacterium]|nr:hypothetical protein [Bacteriovoracaceae bacterium]